MGILEFRFRILDEKAAKFLDLITKSQAIKIEKLNLPDAGDFYFYIDKSRKLRAGGLANV